MVDPPSWWQSVHHIHSAKADRHGRRAMAAGRATRIFAGAGHFTSASGERFRGGIFRTSPGENEWRPVSAGLPEGVEARAFLVDPDNTDVIYAGTQEGPYRSTDGGERW